MSAFIVSDDTMHTVVTALTEHIRRWRSHNRAEFANMNLWETDGVETKIGGLLYAMNAQAVETRYSEAQEPIEYSFAQRRTNAHAAYKAVQCLLYQCCEGEINGTPLYRELETFRHNLADQIVTETPEYNAAPWG